MKLAITLAITITALALNARSQTEIELAAFRMINDYRDSLGIPRLEWHQPCAKAASMQAEYLECSGPLISHSQTTPGAETFDKRYRLSGGGKYFLLAEICCYVPKNIRKGEDPKDKMARAIVEAWKASPDHCAIMTEPKMRNGGVSISLSQAPTGISKWLAYRAYSAMLLVDKK